MKNCPFCGAEIGDSAQFCLYCMAPLNDKDQVFLKRKKKIRWVLILAVIAVVAVLGMLVLPNMWKPISKGPNIDSTALGKSPGSSHNHTETGTASASESTAQPATEPAVSVATEPTVPSTAEPTVEATVPPTTEPPMPPTTEPSVPPTSEPTVPSVTEAPHSHDYIMENPEAEYLKAAATCLSPATYYYSCSCGKRGNATFTYGKRGSHTPETVYGYPATCTTDGMTNGTICAVCKDNLSDAVKIYAVGHTYNLGYEPSPCLYCGEMGTVVIHPLEFPLYEGSKYRIDSCTYSIEFIPASKSWMILLYTTYTNISSEDQYGGCSSPSLFMPDMGYGMGAGSDQNGAGRMKPNESHTSAFSFSIPVSQTTLILYFDSI